MRKVSILSLAGMLACAFLVLGAATNKAAGSFIAGEVTDTGGIDDRSFNASAWRGLQQAQSELGIQVQYLGSSNQSDYAPNIQQFVTKKADIIVTVGFLMGDDTAAAAKAN
ncbi:MAG: BMP family ABC transporter substrate-binding protein, partial [Spirochaetia bacterium]